MLTFRRQSRKLRLLGCIVAIAAVQATFAVAQTSAVHYYVSTSGNDSNSGSQSAPWKTLQRAADLAQPGWVIHVAPGTYNSTTYCSVSGLISGTTMVCMQQSGTAAQPITFVSDQKWGAKLACGTNGTALFALIGSYITVKGFDMTCPNGTFGGGIYGNNGNNTFSDNYLHDFAVNACTSSGVLFDGDAGHDVFDGNIIRHGGAATSAQPQCNQYHGIYMSSPNSVATNNVISGIIGLGIHAYGGGVCHQTIANNTVFDNVQGGIISENVGGTSGHADQCGNGGATDYETIVNNVVANNGVGQSYTGGWGGITLYGTNVGTHNVVSNNLAYGNSPSQISVQNGSSVNQKTGTNSTVFAAYQADKNWSPATSYNSANYALKAGSPALDAGTSSCAAGASNCPASRDIQDNARPQGSGYDIGAFEYGTSYALATSTTAAAPGKTLSASWTAPAASSATDWIALYKVGDPNTTYGAWMYTGGAATGTFSTTAPSATGSYEFRYLLNGGYTDVARSSTINVSGSTDTTAPSVPTGLAAAAASSSQINVTWQASTDNVGVAGYKVYRDGAQIATVQTTSYSDTGLAAGSSHSYTVAAYDAAGNTSAQSSAVTATATAASLAILSVNSSSVITINWLTNAAANGQIQYGPTTSYGSSSAVATALTTSHSITLSGLTPGTTYHFQTISVDGSGNRAVSADSTFTTAKTTN